MYNAHPYFPLKNLGKKVHIIHGKIQYNIHLWRILDINFKIVRGMQFFFFFFLNFYCYSITVVCIRNVVFQTNFRDYASKKDLEDHHWFRPQFPAVWYMDISFHGKQDDFMWHNCSPLTSLAQNVSLPAFPALYTLHCILLWNASALTLHLSPTFSHFYPSQCPFLVLNAAFQSAFFLVPFFNHHST